MIPCPQSAETDAPQLASPAGSKYRHAPPQAMHHRRHQSRPWHGSRVEERRGGLGHAATLRFLSSLIEPYMLISNIRLSDWLHREAHGGGLRCTLRRRSTPSSPKI